MNYLSVSQMAKKWNMSERGVRKYCAEDKIPRCRKVEGYGCNIVQLMK